MTGPLPPQQPAPQDPAPHFPPQAPAFPPQAPAFSPQAPTFSPQPPLHDQAPPVEQPPPVQQSPSFEPPSLHQAPPAPQQPPFQQAVDAAQQPTFEPTQGFPFPQGGQQPYQPQFQQPFQPAFPPAQPPRSGGSRGTVVAMVGIVGVLALLCVAGIVGVFWFLRDDKSGLPGAGSGDIAGLIDYRTDHPEWLSQEHRPQDSPIEYPMTPPAGGPHYPMWQRCNGDVYTAPIDNGSAVHSLEHGAVWITYQPDMRAADVGKLAKRVRGNDYLMLSPYPGQAVRVSLQAWGYQLQLSSVDDDRIDDFILAYRQTATMEPGVPCSTGSTETGG